jgi:anti-sigma28 factor (negative regulator of flagellin synthesis)
MRISDAEVQNALRGSAVEKVDDNQLAVALGVDADQASADAAERDAMLVKDLTKKILAAPDREEMINSLKARIEAGEYNPSAEEIVDTMVRRAIADRMR